MTSDIEIENMSIKGIFDLVNGAVVSAKILGLAIGFYLGGTLMEARILYNCNSAQQLFQYMLDNELKSLISCVLLMLFVPLSIFYFRRKVLPEVEKRCCSAQNYL